MPTAVCPLPRRDSKDDKTANTNLRAAHIPAAAKKKRKRDRLCAYLAAHRAPSQRSFSNGDIFVGNLCKMQVAAMDRLRRSARWGPPGRRRRRRPLLRHRLLTALGFRLRHLRQHPRRSLRSLSLSRGSGKGLASGNKRLNQRESKLTRLSRRSCMMRVESLYDSSLRVSSSATTCQRQ